MGEFLKTWYGLTLFIVFDAAAVFAVMAIAYRWLFKRVWDMIVSLVCMAVLSPLYLAIFIRGKLFQKRTESMKSLISREFYVGKKAKAIVLHTFCTADDGGGEAGKYGRWLKKTGFYTLPYLADVFCGRLSFIGVKKLSFADAAFVPETEESRFGVRPGLINPLTETGDLQTNYKEMFVSDARYVRRVSLFGDLKIFLVWLLKKVRGGKSSEWLGVTASQTYAETLLAEGGITREDFDIVTANAEAEKAELRKRYEEPEEDGDSEKDGGIETNGAEAAASGNAPSDGETEAAGTDFRRDDSSRAGK